MTTPDAAIDQINDRFGKHPGHRALHAKGTVCQATFVAPPEARDLSRALHLQGNPVAAIVRFSNGSGNPRSPDWAPDVRGMAVKLTLPDGTRTDIVAQSAPRFPVDSMDAFLALVKAGDIGPAALWRLPLFLARNPKAGPSMLPNFKALNPPPSYASIPYFGVHSFRWVTADGTATYVRCTLEPVQREASLSPKKARELGRDHLQDDLRARLEMGDITFTLRAQLAEDGDDVDDPRSMWPASRRVIDAGTITVTGLDNQREKDGDVLVFDPTRVVDGIELSDDPILAVRSAAYSASVARRMPS